MIAATAGIQGWPATVSVSGLSLLVVNERALCVSTKRQFVTGNGLTAADALLSSYLLERKTDGL